MINLFSGACSFVKSEKASIATEYVLIAFGISIVIVVGVFAIGDSVVGMFSDVSTNIIAPAPAQ